MGGLGAHAARVQGLEWLLEVGIVLVTGLVHSATAMAAEKAQEGTKRHKMWVLVFPSVPTPPSLALPRPTDGKALDDAQSIGP